MTAACKCVTLRYISSATGIWIYSVRESKMIAHDGVGSYWMKVYYDDEFRQEQNRGGNGGCKSDDYFHFMHLAIRSSGP